ncbi:MAG: Ubiquinone/menaquinone biosynthesis C-methyltransferase UbiE [Elusimicrobia bacterium]|nr:Ubiquinone/menaquinone biosynthesis C-methyltransferase UbiE [Elusimicrobiota bacterium]
MFDALVPEYDRFNRLSSLGLDVLWRREVASMFSKGSYILDVGTGTGDLAKELVSQGMDVVGVDFSSKMLDAAKEKMAGNPHVVFELAKADELQFGPRTFDGITSAFVIRNLHHGNILSQSFREFYRVLKPQSQMIHLELSRPPSGFLSWGHKAYLKFILPLIGRANFGERWPKDYLSTTIEKFPEPKILCQQMRWAGFERVCHYPLNGGIAGLFVGWRC